MIFNFFNKIFNEKPVFKFLSIMGDYSINTAVKAAKDVRPFCYDAQKGSPASKRYQICPGITDYANAGYIIVAHTDISIKANSVGTFVKISATPGNLSQHESNGLNPDVFDFTIVNGLVHVDKVKKEAKKVPLPWGIEAPAGYSAYVMPAIMHSDFLDKIHVYPGVVDYDNFHTINFIFSPIKECEFMIPAGTPILQVIFFKREEFNAVCRKATPYEKDKYYHNRTSWTKNWYRRTWYGKKIYKMECPYNNKNK